MHSRVLHRQQPLPVQQWPLLHENQASQHLHDGLAGGRLATVASAQQSQRFAGCDPEGNIAQTWNRRVTRYSRPLRMGNHTCSSYTSSKGAASCAVVGCAAAVSVEGAAVDACDAAANATATSASDPVVGNQ